jgi:hypothetical protein
MNLTEAVMEMGQGKIVQQIDEKVGPPYPVFRFIKDKWTFQMGFIHDDHIEWKGGQYRFGASDCYSCYYKVIEGFRTVKLPKINFDKLDPPIFILCRSCYAVFSVCYIGEHMWVERGKTYDLGFRWVGEHTTEGELEGGVWYCPFCGEGAEEAPLEELEDEDD